MTGAFIPPYLLSAIAASGDDAAARRASRTLRADGELRRRRQTTSPDAAPPVELPRDDGSAPSRGIFDAGGGTDLPGRAVRLEGAPATGDAAADEAYDGLGATWRLWREVFARDSLDGRGEPLLGSVHYGRDYDNAFWDGTQMVFGDGDGVIFGRFTASLDVVAHELAHAVTERTAGLVYSGQSGALNEHLSDVFGILVKQRELDQSAAESDWLIGAELLLPGVAGRAIRSMSAPGTAYDDPRLGKDPQPSSMAGYVETRADNGGVHLNSGIPNRAFHLAAVALGGPAWAAPGLIWYDTMLGPIKPDCDFGTFAGLTIAAAEQRYGAGSREAGAVRAAWVEVGVLAGDAGGPDGPPPGEPPTPTPRAPRATGELTVTKTGGFAGLQRERSVSLAELPVPKQREWGRALGDRDLLDPADVASWPDAYCYGITCTAPLVDVQVPEPAMPDLLLTLVEELLDGD